MALTDLRSKYGSVDTLLFENQFDKALNELTNVINTLVNDNTLIQDKDGRNLLIVACIKRIDLNYQRKKFNDILNDITVLERVNYNVYRNFDLFAKKLEAKSEIHKDDLNDELQKLEVHSAESEAVKENVALTFDIDKMYSRIGPKPPKKSRR